MDVGIELRAARERRGLSLGHISDTTKISLPVLQAIEAADERRLPAKVFTRSFVKSYAALVGLDPDETTRRYLEQLTPPPAADPALLDSDSATPAPAETPVRPAARVLHGRFTTAGVLFLVAISAAALGMRQYRHGRVDSPSPTASAVSTAGVA